MDLGQYDRNRLVVATFEPDHSCTHNMVPLFETVAEMTREAKAKAWDEGYEAGKDSEVYNDSPENPYRD